MPRYAILRYSTDMRRPNTKIEFTSSRKGALKASEEPMRFTHSDPDAARNYHHDITEVYELPKGWRKPSDSRLRELARQHSTPTYPRTASDVLGSIIRREGLEFKPPRGY